MNIRAAPRVRKPPATFARLNAQFPLRPLADDDDYENAREMADRLAVLPRRTRDQEDYLETLSLLMERFEHAREAWETRDVGVLPILRQLLANHDMSASDLGRLLGNRTLGAAILRGDRELSKSHIVALARRFKVDPGLFLRAG